MINRIFLQMCVCCVLAFQITPNQLLYQQKRYRGKINIQKPQTHHTRLMFDRFLTPFYENPNVNKTLPELCQKLPEQQKLVREFGPYEAIIARDIRNWFDKSKMVACFHKNSITSEEEFDFRVLLKKVNMHYKSYGPKLFSYAVKDTPYIALEPLTCTSFAFVFSPEVNTAALEKIIKKFPQLCLMAGILEGKLLNYHDFLKYGRMDLTSARSSLVQVLQNVGGANLTQQLTHHQSTLVSRLKQIGTNETAKEDEPSVPV